MTAPARRPQESRHIGEPRDGLYDSMSEAQLSEHVRLFCKSLGLLAYHTYRSIRSAPGFPDWVVLAGKTAFFLELKTKTGRVSPEQKAWLHALVYVPGVLSVVVRPANWPEVRDLILKAMEDR